jgi:hypothetical protein
LDAKFKAYFFAVSAWNAIDGSAKLRIRLSANGVELPDERRTE